MGCYRIISLGKHHNQAQLGHPGPNWSDRSHRPSDWRLDVCSGQTGAMVLASVSTPALAPIPNSATPGQTDELEGFVPQYTTKSYGKSPFPLAMPHDVWDDLIKISPHYATHTMSTIDPTVNRLARTSMSSNYETDLARMKADLSTMLSTKLSQLGIDPGKNWLYQRPPDAFDLVPYPTGWRVPYCIKFSGDNNWSTWEHISQYVAQLGEASSSKSLWVRLFSLFFTRTTFSWFSTLSRNSVRSWIELEQKFYDHFIVGKMKLN